MSERSFDSATAGVLLLDKPAGPSSRQAVQIVQERLRLRPVGHAGTLDPLASGLLVVLLGRARRLQEFLTGKAKRYRAWIRFGFESVTLDGEGPVAPTGRESRMHDVAAAQEALAGFVGTQLQVPPLHCARHVQGQRAHDRARRGEPVQLAPREVVIHELQLVSFSLEEWVVDVACSAGTYVRSLARDLGLAAGSGAYLSGLRRLASGSFRVEDAVPPEQAAPEHLQALRVVLAREQRVDFVGEDVSRLWHGNTVMVQGYVDPSRPAFAWVDGEPCFRLVFPHPGFARSDLLIRDPFASST